MVSHLVLMLEQIWFTLYGSFDISNDGKLEGILLGGSLGYTDNKMLGSDEGIKLAPNDGKVIGTILGDLDGITLWSDVGIYLGFFDRYFDGSNDGNK